jgi:hypothetical protein
MITRRDFIQLFGVTAIAGLTINSPINIFGQSSGDLYRIPAESMTDPLFSFTSAHFTPFINDNFAVRSNESFKTTPLRLIEVEILEHKENLAKGFTGESFSLLFSGSHPENVAGDMFEFSHPSLGVFTLFLAPVGKEPNRYQAIVSHLTR